MDNEQKTKTCEKCGRVLPLSEFMKSNKTSDGYRHQCRSCTRDAISKGLKKGKKQFDLYDFVCDANKAKLNPELAKFTPRQLQEELSARGFHGTLEFSMKAKL